MDFEANALKWAAFSGIEIETTKRILGDEKLRVRANQKQATLSPTTGQLGPAKKAIVQIWPRGVKSMSISTSRPSTINNSSPRPNQASS